MSRNRVVGVVVAVVVLMGMVVGGMVMWGGGERRGNVVVHAGAVQRVGVATRQAATRPGLRVGVYLSKVTGEEVGYSCQMTGELLNKGMEVVPVLEPGSEGDAKVGKLLGIYFKGERWVNVMDAGELGKLDVIVAPRIWMLPEGARGAIEGAVREGTGLLIRDGLGCMEPGGGEGVSRLSGFRESGFGYNAHPMECEVVGEHALLGTLKVGEKVTITPNGTWGVVGEKTVPLVRVKDMGKFREFYHHGGEGWVFYPLYVGELGKGRIVGCQWPAWERMPKDLQGATGGEFNVRAVKWAAKRGAATREGEVRTE